MTYYYADTSWWVAFKLRGDIHHHVATALFTTNPEAQIIWTPWNRVEVFNAFYQAEREGKIDPGDGRRAVRSLNEEVRAGYWLHREPKWTDTVRLACQITAALGSKMPIRGMDLFHVAVALKIRSTHFLSFDKDQNALAVAVALQVPHGE